MEQSIQTKNINRRHCPMFKIARVQTNSQNNVIIIRIIKCSNNIFRPLEACAHSFFDVLRDPSTKLPSMKSGSTERDLPPLFDFTRVSLGSGLGFPLGLALVVLLLKNRKNGITSL